MSAPPKLVSLSYSPWSERARWALDHHGLSYRTVEHAPFIGELRLRRLARGRKGRATVPVLIDGDVVLTESWDIALYADRVGAATKLIPPESEVGIRRWTVLADQTSAEGRALVIHGLLGSAEAVDESLPPQVPGWIRPALRPITRIGMRWFARKYDLHEDAAAQEQKIREALETLRAALANGPYLLGRFSYADIAMASLLQGVSPVANVYIPLGAATREAWTRPRLADEFPDLIRWRDQLYLDHRTHRASRAAS